MIIQTPTKQISGADLERLRTAGFREGKEIEYKEKLNLANDEQKRKFVASIASFANASGGELVFGVRAENGVPKELVPLEAFEPDRDILRLRDIIRAHIDPPLFGVEFKEVRLKAGHALVIRVPRGWHGAHIVTFGDDNRFYARDQNGRVLMNVAEIRAAFTVSEALAERIRRFRAERFSAIRAGEIPLNLEPGPKFVLHLLPLRSLEPGFRANLHALLAGQSFQPMKGASGRGHTHDVEGCYVFETIQGHPSFGYSLAFRTGAIEVVHSFIGAQLQNRLIPNPGFEEDLLTFLPRCIGWLRLAEVEAPVAVALSLLDIKDFILDRVIDRFKFGVRKIRQRDLIIPDVLMESFDEPPASVLRPICDAVWHACGLERSFNFDEEGQFKSQSR